MNKGQFSTQINEAERILKIFDLFKERIVYPKYVNYSAEGFRKLAYFDIWKKCYEDQLYDLRLIDDSLIQFRAASFSPLRASYVYYECPYKPLISFDIFIEQARFSYGDDKDEYELLREHELLKPEIKESITPLRYDYDTRLYKQGRHPASHMHFGHKNNIRVGTKKILKPLSFMLFVIRQCYPDYWEKLTNSDNVNILCRNISESLDEVEAAYWQERDNWEMVLV